MKIGINARPLVMPFTGIGQYVKNLMQYLGELDAVNEYVLVVPSKIPKEIEEKFEKNIEVRILPEKKRAMSGIKKTYWEQIQVPEFFSKEKVDIAFFPYPSNPWVKSWYKKGIRTIVTVHDCIPWKEKAYRKGILSKMYHKQTLKAVSKADEVLTVSESSKKDIVELCHVYPLNVKVTHLDASDEYKGNMSKGLFDEVLSKFGLQERGYFIYAGGYDKRKNVENLVKEYCLFANENKDADLVLAGGKLYDDKLYKSFDKVDGAGHECVGRIIRTGFLEERELHALYYGALGFVHFSLVEGFNIPILEAANSALPLILSDIPVHREVAGDAGIYVDLSVEGDGAAKMASILDEGKWEKASRAAVDLAGDFSWNKCAKATYKFMLP